MFWHRKVTQCPTQKPPHSIDQWERSHGLYYRQGNRVTGRGLRGLRDGAAHPLLRTQELDLTSVQYSAVQCSVHIKDNISNVIL